MSQRGHNSKCSSGMTEFWLPPHLKGILLKVLLTQSKETTYQDMKENYATDNFLIIIVYLETLK